MAFTKYNKHKALRKCLIGCRYWSKKDKQFEKQFRRILRCSGEAPLCTTINCRTWRLCYSTTRWGGPTCVSAFIVCIYNCLHYRQSAQVHAMCNSIIQQGNKGQISCAFTMEQTKNVFLLLENEYYSFKGLNMWCYMIWGRLHDLLLTYE